MTSLASTLTLVATMLASSTSGGCGGCTKREPPEGEPWSSESVASEPPAPAALAVKEVLPRCRPSGSRLAIPGERVVPGDAAIANDSLFLGILRREGKTRVASVVRASLDLTRVHVFDLGSALGDDPPPSPRVQNTKMFVAAFTHATTGARTAAKTRILEVLRLEADAFISEGTVVQQADESFAYDVAWPYTGAGKPIVAWDEDAPVRPNAFASDRGVVKVQGLGTGALSRVLSPETTDAEAPRLLARPGGYWLAWLARRPEAGEDGGSSHLAEAPGENRAHGWVEVVALDANGEASSPVRRVSPERGHAVSFDLVSATPLVVLVQDEAAHAEGEGGRVYRYALESDKMAGGDWLDGGVGHGLAEVVARVGAQGADSSRPGWIFFTDTQERAHLAPLAASLSLSGAPSAEPELDGARVVAAAVPPSVYAIGGVPASPRALGTSDLPSDRVELRRLVCQ